MTEQEKIIELLKEIRRALHTGACNNIGFGECLNVRVISRYRKLGRKGC